MFKRLNDPNDKQHCPVCDEEKIRFIRNLPKDYQLFACTRCGCGFCSPFSTPSADFYTRAADVASSSRHAGPTQWYGSHPTRQSSIFAKEGKGLLLDVGCGNGAFAEFATSVGYQVVGIDMDAASIEIARSRNLPAEFHCCTIDDFFSTQSDARKFDVVTMFEVFEHLPRPRSVIEVVKKLLREDGMVVGSLPNTERLLMWQLNMNYELPPYHLTYWTTKSWSNFLKQSEFNVLRCEPTIYYGYISDVLINRYKLPDAIKHVIASYIYPLEFKFEKHYQMGASFYFEAKLNKTEPFSEGFPATDC